MNHQSKLDKKFATWRGIPREEIERHPIVDKDKGTGCDMITCFFNIFDLI